MYVRKSHVRYHASKQMNVSYFYCGNYGHVMNDCYIMKKDDLYACPNKSSSKGQKNISYFYCGQIGYV